MAGEGICVDGVKQTKSASRFLIFLGSYIGVLTVLFIHDDGT